MINGIWLNLKCKNLNNFSSKWQTKFGSTKDFNHSGSKMKTSKKKEKKEKKKKRNTTLSEEFKIKYRNRRK